MDGRCYGCCIIGRMGPVVVGERIAELLKLLDGCNALLVGGRDTYGISNPDVAACAPGSNQSSWLSGLCEWRHAAVISRAANMPVATLSVLRGIG